MSLILRSALPLLFNLILAPWLHASELQTLYQTAQSQLTDEQNLINNAQGLPPDQQQLLQKALQETQQSIQSIYQKAATTKPVSLASTGSQIKRALATLKSKITSSQARFRWTQGRSAAIEKSKEKSSQEQTFEKALRKLQSDLQPAYFSLNKALEKKRTALPVITLQGKFIYNDQAIQEVTNSFEEALQKATQAYSKSSLAGRASNSSSFVMTIMRNWENFFEAIIAKELEAISFNKKNSDSYYALLALLANHIQGSSLDSQPAVQKLGYLKTIENAYATYLPFQKTELKNFIQRIINKTYQTIQIGLTSLANAFPNPSDQQVSYAHTYFTTLLFLGNYSDKQTAATQAQQLNETMALINLNLAKTIIQKRMILGKNNQPLRLQAIQAYTAAVTNFTQAGKTNEATIFQGFARALQQAENLITQAESAENASNFSGALTNYQEALNQLKIAGDSSDSDFVTQKIAQLQGQAIVQQTKSSLTDFQNQTSTHLAKLLTIVEQGDLSQSPLPFIETLQATQQLVTLLAQTYQNALQNYQTLNNKNSATLHIITQIENQATILADLNTIFAQLTRAAQLAQTATADALLAAEANHRQAQAAALQVDSLLTKLPTATPLFNLAFISSTTTLLTYAQFVTQYLALVYLWIGQQSSDTLLTLQYYTTINQYLNQLPTPLIHTLTLRLQKIAQQQKDLKLLATRASQEQQAAETLRTQAWIAEPQQKIYNSPATTSWQSTLNDYWSAYMLGDAASFALFLTAAERYTQLYHTNVPKNWFPAAGAALIAYRSFLALKKGGKGIEADTYSTTVIKPLITEFMQGGLSLLGNLSATSLSMTASTDIEQLEGWVYQAENMLREQENILSIYAGPQASTIKRLLIKQETDSLTTYQDTLVNLSVTLPSLTQEKAITYKKLADTAMNQENYAVARSYYARAQQSYGTLNQTDQAASLTPLYNQATTLYYASYYANSVIAQGAVQLGQFFKVPTQYQLNLYGLLVPDELMQLLPSSDQLKNQQQRSSAEINLAAQLFLYTSLASHFETSRAQILLKIIGTALQNSALSLTAQLTNKGFSSDEQTAITALLLQAQSFQKDLTQRIKNNSSNLVLENIGTPQKPQFRLWEYKKPIPPVPSTTPPYQNYPDAFTYYNLAYQLFGTQSVQLGTQVFAPGNKPTKVAELTQKIILTWLSHGYEMQEKINQLKQNPQINLLKNSSKSSSNLKLAAYMPLYQQMKSLYGGLDSVDAAIPYPLLVSYQEPFALQNLIDPASPTAQQLTSLVAASYKQAGDALSLFLVGDPTDPNYTTVINTVAGYYVAAITNYSYDPALYLAIGDLYTNAGQLIKQTNNYLAALQSFFAAQSFYNQAPATNSLTITALQNIAHKIGTTEFYGATDSVKQYAQQRFSTITITQPDGSTTSTDFATLQAAYESEQNSFEDDTSAPEDQKIEDLKNLLLNAMIFYMDASSQIMKVTPSTGGQDTSSLSSAATDLINSYSDEKKIDLSTAETVMTFIKRADFIDLLNGAFDNFSKNASQATSIKAASLWANKIYFALGLVYMQDFLGGVSTDGWTSLTADITARVNALRSDSEDAV